MNTQSDDKIVRFPTDHRTNSGSSCESCGSPQTTSSLCRPCAARLVDIALSSSSGELTELPMEGIGQENLTPQHVQPRYGHYEICLTEAGDPWELGRGSMGITYKATDTDLHCPVALKIINTGRLGGAGARARFLQEARTAAGLRHANIASVFHLGTKEGDCFYAMEYIEGETLEALVLREGPLPWRAALSIVAQSARALQAAHAKQFIHRDIKPTNIMLIAEEQRVDEGASVKIIDFGLVKTMVDDGVNDALCEGYFAGTPRYASPEQIESGTVDARSDIYSLGQCFSYMLTGVPPEPPSVVSAMMPPGCILTPPEANLSADIPAPVLALLRSMVSADPRLRPASAEEVRRRIASYLAGAGTSKPPGRRWVAQAGVGILSAVSVLVVVIHGAFLDRNRQPTGSPQPAPAVSAESKALYARGIEYYRKYTREDMQRAIGCISKSAEISPAYSDAFAMLANLYFEDVSRFNAPGGELDLAVAHAQRAIAVDPNNAKAFLVLGGIRNFQGDPWEALSQLHRALELDPKSIQAMCNYSLLWICVGQPQKALPWAKAAANLAPSEVDGWHAAAEASVEMCADAQAEECYERCTELKPVWMSGYCGLIHIHLLQGDFAGARRAYMKAESIQPGLVLTLTLKAQIELFSGEFAEAEIVYRRLLTINRSGLTRYYSGISYLSALGYLRLRAGDASEGQALLDEAEKLHSANSGGSEDVYDLAAIRAIQNRKEDALALLGQAINSGWNDYRATRLDPRFAVLRSEPQFHKMLEDLDVHATQMRKEAEALCGKAIDLLDYPVTTQQRSVVK